MNNNQIEREIVKVESYLTEEQLTKDIIHVKNTELISYLESIGEREIKYETGIEPELGKFTEVGGVVSLWQKDINDEWIINYYNVKKFFK